MPNRLIGPKMSGPMSTVLFNKMSSDKLGLLNGWGY